MSQELTQWIAEVRTLQRQLADTRQERDQAYNSAANWQRLYETEARQRREETANLRAQVRHLQTQLQQTEAKGDAVGNEVRHNLKSADSMDDLQSQLEALVTRCQDLTNQLDAEKEAHAKTLKSLTAALGDAFDTLTPEKSLVLKRD
jgi:predicted  nucleic acid-binding Zn-ribbon protein